MKILLDARMYGLEHTGVGRYIENLTEELKKLRTKEEFVILLRKKYYKSLDFSRNWTKVLADYPHYSFAEQIKLPVIIRKYKPDLVHFPHFNVPIVFHTRFVVTIHDMNMHKQGIGATKLPPIIYYFKRLAYKYTFRTAVLSSVRIITPTKHVKNEIVNYFGIDKNRIEVVCEGLSEKFKQALHKKSDEVLKQYKLQNKKYFLYFGNLYPHKNVKTALEAIVQINQKRKDKVFFALACPRSVFTDRLIDIIDKLNAGRFVKLLGFVPDEHLTVLLNNSVAFVYPSLSEGFGLQGLESMAAGTLVLASDIPVFKEVYKDNALYFNPKVLSSIKKVMVKALKMRVDRRKETISKGKKYVLRFSWSKMAKQTLIIYRDLRTYN